LEDVKIKLKYEHTYRVAALCDRIAKSLHLNQEDIDMAWCLGMFHDIGRFDQVRRYGTFQDAVSCNHADLSADILYKEGKVREYFQEKKWDALMEKAIRLHNVLHLPDTLTERERLFTQILRDADKVDILKVNCDTPMEEIYDVSEDTLKNGAISKAVWRDALAWQTVDRSHNQTAVDHLVSHICLVFGLVYPESLKIVQEQGYLQQMLHFQSRNPETLGRLKRLETCMDQFVRSKNTDFKIVFTDLDGTFLNKEKMVMPITKQVVEEFVHNGGELVLSSSRPPKGIEPIAKQLDVKCAVSAYGGALLLDENGQVLYEKGMDREKARKILAFIEEELPFATWSIYTAKDWVVKDCSNPKIQREALSVGFHPTEGTIDDIPEDTMVDKLLCIVEEEDMPQLEKQLQRAFPEMHIVKSAPRYLEINESGINKGLTVEKLCEHRGIDITQTIGFGDNFNDIEMLHTVGQAVTMRNGAEAIRDSLYFITDSNNDDGVGRALLKLL